MTRFSVVIATCGRPDRLRRTLESLQSCRPGPFEVLVVDGDPERSARDVLEHVSVPAGAARPRYLPSETGLTIQRNLSLRHCRGDVVVFFDDDVLLSPDLFTLLENAYRTPEVVGATGRVIEDSTHRFGRKESPLRRWLPGGGDEGSFTRFGYPRYITRTDVAREVEFMQGCFMSSRLDAARRVGFDESLPGYGLAEDEDFSCRLARLGRLRYLPEALVTHEQASTTSYDSRTLSKQIVVNRSYLFHKNFNPTPLAHLQFGLLIAILLAHRVVNFNWGGALGLLEGVVAARAQRGRLQAPDHISVTVVSSHARMGGSERYLEALLDELGESWVQQVVCLERGPLVERLRARGHDAVILQTTGRLHSILASAWRLRRELMATRPDVVHANGVKAALCARLATMGVRIPIVWVKHDFAWDGWVSRFISSGCAQVVGVSEAVTGSLNGHRGDDVRVVHTGAPKEPVDRAEGRARLARELGCSADERVVGLVGRLHPVKGHLELVEILPSLIEAVGEIKVAVIGGQDPGLPEHAEIVQRRVKELGMDHVVSFLGERDDAMLLTGGCDVIAIPSIEWGRGMGREGFPLVGLEALSVGTTVVGYRTGGLPELVGECGLLVPPEDRIALREALSEILSNPPLRDRLASCGRRRARDRFSSERMVERMRRCYREAAGSNRN